MNRGDRRAGVFGNFGEAAEGIQDLFYRHANGVYDNRMFDATGNTTFALDADCRSRHSIDMRSASEILAVLKERGVKQGSIAKVLGVQQPNVSTLYNPAKNGKTRQLGYDEALALIEAFDLKEWVSDGEFRPPAPVNADVLEPLIDVLLPLAPPSTRMTDQSRRALAEAFAYGLGLLDGHPSKTPSDDALSVAARAAASRFRDLMN